VSTHKIPLVQLGSTLDGEAANDEFGLGGAMSADGYRIAVGGRFNDAGGNNAGHVRVFEWDDNTSDWVQLGADLDGDAPSDEFGFAVTMSHDGSRVATGGLYNDTVANDAGQFKVFEWSGSAWVQVGNTIYGEASTDRFGSEVEFSADGNRIAVGAYRSEIYGSIDTGYFKVFDWNGTSWEQVGQTVGANYGSYALFGYKMSFQDDGQRIAVSAYAEDTNYADGGTVRTFTLGLDENGQDEWQQYGQTLTGIGNYNQFGLGLCMSADGNRMSVGAPRHNANGTDSGRVIVYDWNGVTWQQVGQTLEGHASYQNFGFNTWLSGDGLRLAVGAHEADSNDGYFHVYDFDGGRWRQYWAEERGGTNDFFGRELVLSNDGLRVLAGARQGDTASGSNSGYAKVFAVPDLVWRQRGIDLVNPDIPAPNGQMQFGSALGLSSGGGIVAVGVPGPYSSSSQWPNYPKISTFSWDGTTWQPYGEAPAEGPSSGDSFVFSRFGWEVSISDDGSRIAGGAIGGDFARVYERQNDSWVQLGSDLTGPTGSLFGLQAKLSADGTRLAVGAPEYSVTSPTRGLVRVFEWSGSAWVQQGPDLEGSASLDEFGGGVHMSADGNRLAVGAPQWTTAAAGTGYVRVFDWNSGTSSWDQVGSDIVGTGVGDEYGWSVRLNASGSRIIIGAAENDDAGNNAGHVEVYDWTGSAWVQVGTDIYGEAAGDYAGGYHHNVGISADGGRIVVSSYGSDAAGTDVGLIRAFRYDSVTLDWVEEGRTLFGGLNDIEENTSTTEYYQAFGESVAMSADGAVIGAGAPDLQLGTGPEAGSVRIFSRDVVSVNVYNGSGWDKRPLKYWDGTAWFEPLDLYARTATGSWEPVQRNTN